MSRQLTAIWIATWKCTLRCPYCVNLRSGITPQQSAGLVGAVDYDKWLEIWRRYNPNKLVISGGEPFLIPNMIDIVNGLNPPELCINTNFTHDIAQMADGLKSRPNLLFSVGCQPLQYHPDKCFENIDTMLSKGFRVVVVFVADPKQLHMYAQIKAECHYRNIQLFVAPCIDPHGHVQHTPEEAKFVASICNPNRYHFINRPIAQKLRTCSGGYNYMCVVPNGDTYRCSANAVSRTGHEIIGNILTNDNVLLDTPMNSCTYGKCCSCDEDHTHCREGT